MAWFNKDDYVRTPYRRRRAANYRTFVAGLLVVFSALILSMLILLVLMPMKKELPDLSSWELAQVEAEAPLSEEFSVTCLVLSPENANQKNTTVSFDARAYDALCKMLNDARELGYTPVVVRGYESAEAARERFFAEQSRLRQSGFSASEAYALALKAVPLPSLNEYRLGLTVDLSCKENVLDFENTQFYEWLCEHARDYGFVERYNADFEAYTGGSADASVWRYVGVTNAKQMAKKGLCLERYADDVRILIAEEQEKENRNK